MAQSEAERLVSDRRGPGRSVPAVALTHAEAGAFEFPSSTSRRFVYFEPAGNYPTVYEDVTVDVQSDLDRHIRAGWIYAFADGRPSFDEHATRLRCEDWHAFRDPNEDWERTLFSREANVERQIEQVLAVARASDSFGDWDGRWAAMVESHVGAWMHVEYALGMHVFLPAQREASTNMINNALAVNAAHKLRMAQDLLLYIGDVAAAVPGFEETAHVEAWLSAAAWQPTRAFVERLTAVKDWAEALFVANVVLEPLVAELFRRELVMRLGPRHGDWITPVVVAAGAADFARDDRWTTALLGLLVRDPVHDLYNRRVLREWLRSWTPPALAAVEALSRVWVQVPNAVPALPATDRVRKAWKRRLGALRVVNFTTL